MSSGKEDVHIIIETLTENGNLPRFILMFVSVTVISDLFTRYGMPTYLAVFIFAGILSSGLMSYHKRKVKTEIMIAGYELRAIMLITGALLHHYVFPSLTH